MEQPAKKFLLSGIGILVLRNCPSRKCSQVMKGFLTFLWCLMVSDLSWPCPTFLFDVRDSQLIILGLCLKNIKPRYVLFNKDLKSVCAMFFTETTHMPFFLLTVYELSLNYLRFKDVRQHKLGNNFFSLKPWRSIACLRTQP